jgi:hypothetical protein
LFTVPVPGSVIGGALAGAVGGASGQLRGLGLLGPYLDLRDPASTALAASLAASSRISGGVGP